MKPEYDFWSAERGKFFRPEAVLRLPIYLDPEVQDYFAAKAQAKNIELDDLVNDLLKKDGRRGGNRTLVPTLNTLAPSGTLENSSRAPGGSA